MIKVGVIGTHGTRKTSLCYDFAAKLRVDGINAGYMEEVARTLPSHPGFKINEKTTRESQLWILHTQIKEELEYEARRDFSVLFTDRTVIDNYMYYLFRFGKDNLALDAFVNDWTKNRYNLLVKLPIVKNNSLEKDTVRAEELEFQIGIDALLERELLEREIPFYKYTTTEDLIQRVISLWNQERK